MAEQEAAEPEPEPEPGKEVEQSQPVLAKQPLERETKEFPLLLLLKQHCERFQADDTVVIEGLRKPAAQNVAALALSAVDEPAAALVAAVAASAADAAFAAVVAVERANLMPAAAFAEEAYSNSVAVAPLEVAFAADSRGEEHNLREAWTVAAENLAAALLNHDGVEHFRANFPKGRRVQVHRRVHARKECCNHK